MLAAQLLGACRPDVTVADMGNGVDGGSSADGSVTPGAPDRFLLAGTIVTPDQVIVGQVLVEGATITCVAAGDQCSTQTGATGATFIDTGGIIAPGMIDTHNHILFDIFDENDWKPAKVYTNHDQWTTEPRYAAMLDVKQCLVNDSQGKPTWCANTPYGTAAGSLRCEVDKFGELKGLVAGTTSIVGLPGTSAACFGSVARSIDVSQNGLGTDSIQTSATFPPSKTSADGVCSNFASGTTTAYLIHCGEGTDAKALGEFATLGSVSTTPGCLLAPPTTITHGTAFGPTEFMTMAQKGVKLTWSPASNVSLYGQTADIPTARTAGVTVALAPDWSMGGSQNLLDEMRFADTWDNGHWSDSLSAQDLLTMTTTNAAAAVGLGSKIGKIEVGYLADLAVYSGDVAKPYDAVLAATPKDVAMVMVGGAVLYGDAALVAAGAAQPPCEMLDVCGAPKFLCIATTAATDKLNQSYADIKAALEKALTAADAQTPADGFNFAPLPPLVRCP
ncbi:MAG: S-adenosylhomocysteine deaminase [bacterium]|nr:S-adenosylhomocysteine deaminase [bacterium]